MEIYTKLLVFAVFAQLAFFPIIMVKMFIKRLKAIKSGRISPGYFKDYNGVKYEVPEHLNIIRSHYSNLHELPVLFLITCLLAITLQTVDVVIVSLAWLFVLGRVIHSYIHLGSNDLRYRYKVFAANYLILLSIWVYILLKVILL